MADVEYEGSADRERKALDVMEQLRREIKRQNELLAQYGPALEQAATHSPTAPAGSLARIAARILTPERMEALADRLIQAIPAGPRPKRNRRNGRKRSATWLPPVI